MRKPIIIALTGDMGHGKTTVAKYLMREHGATRYRFAGPIKGMVAELLTQAGDSRDNAEHIVDDAVLKDTPIREMYGRTPRDFMRAIGDMGRRVNPEFWANIVMTSILADFRDNPDRIFVIDDWRYPQGEGARLRASDVRTTFARVVRPGQPRAVLDHDSEGGLDDWPFDFNMINDEGGFSLLYRQADDLVKMATLEL